MTLRILLTGSPGSGKTTAASKTVAVLEEHAVPVEGFLTEETRCQGRRIGFDLVPLHGPRREMAREGLSSDQQVGRYGVDVGAVDEVARGLQHRLRTLGRDAVVVVDEVGKMELFSSSFSSLVQEVLEGPWSCLVTVTKARVPSARRLLQRRDVKVFDLDEVDRGPLPGRLARELLEGRDRKV